MEFLLDPSVRHLNHGSYGAAPREVLAEQARWRAIMEARPMAFFGSTLVKELEHALVPCAELLHARPQDLVFVRNATTATNAVVASEALGPGVDVVTTNHRYDAVRDTLIRAAERTGARIVTADVPFPLAQPEQITAAVVAAFTDRTRLLCIDHITSPTALVFPVADIAREAHARGIRVAVDGAHAPGQIPVDLEALGVDYWTGNLHKWCFAAKGTAVLWVAPEHQARTRPAVTSLATIRSFQEGFHWIGTDDYTAWLSAPVAVALTRSGMAERAERNHGLVARGRRLVADAVGTALPHPDDPRLYASIATIPLPGRAGTHDRIRMRLAEEHRIDAMPLTWGDRLWIRISGQVYNDPSDYEALAKALPAVLE
jgi:isopenicillin-N epimerase